MQQLARMELIWNLYKVIMNDGPVCFVIKQSKHIGQSNDFGFLNYAEYATAHHCPVVQSFSVQKPSHEKIGVVDDQWIVHRAVPSWEPGCNVHCIWDYTEHC
ncbi:hypothetical protein EJB05_12774 [Eragrostis curvula]|uniref:Uncharacterized protein n=1 Tax=Eragrostis curvula TaxID=38414 RepID=A0A5J9VUP3_9POAL|nr:hypothetical protein EJB05_12774 [Eragrostis curvula]